MSDTPEIAVPIGRFAELGQLRSVYEWDLEFVRGDSLEIVFRMFKDVNCEGDGSRPQTLTGMSARARIRKAIDYPVYVDLTAVVDDSAGSGRVTVTATAEETLLYPEYGIFELQLYEIAGPLAKTVVQGQALMIRDVIL